LERESGEDVLVITVKEAKLTGSDNENFFQYVLYQNGDIKINYRSVFPEEDTIAGIENSGGTEGVSYDLGTSRIKNKSILYTVNSDEPEEPNVPDEPCEDCEPEYATVAELDSAVGNLNSKIESLETEQASAWVVYSDEWTTGIAFYNPTASDITTKVHIGDKTFNLTVPAKTCVKKAITEYTTTKGEYIITVDNYDLILQVPMAYIPDINY
jgi:hypothetical protein